MTARATFRKSDLDKALASAAEKGLTVRAYRIKPDGEIEIECGETVAAVAPIDTVKWSRKRA